MNDSTMEAGPPTDLERRELLRRGAIVLGATALWTTPVVQTLGMRAATAGTADDPTETVLCLDEERAPSNLVFRYEAAATTLAGIEIRRARGPAPGTWCANVSGGQTFQVPGKANPDMAFTIVSGEATESLSLHTSCSQELTIGQRFGSLTLLGGLNGDGDRVGTADAPMTAVAGECAPTQSTEDEDVDDLHEEDVESSENEKAEAEDLQEEDAESPDNEDEKAEAEPEKLEKQEAEPEQQVAEEKQEPEKQEVAEAEPEKQEVAEAEPEKQEATAEVETVEDGEKAENLVADED